MRNRYLIAEDGRIGPIVEIRSDGKFGLPDPPIVQPMDTRRILTDVREQRPLRPVDSALLWKIIERNSEFC